MNLKVDQLVSKSKEITGDWRNHVIELNTAEQGVIRARVQSFTDAGIIYSVVLRRINDYTIEADCDRCDGFAAGNLCKHILSVFRLVLEQSKRDRAEEMPEQPTPEEPLAQTVKTPKEQKTPPPSPVIQRAPTPVEYVGSMPMPVATGVALKKRAAMIEEIIDALDPKKDYGKVPGVDKPFLFQPGAEKLSIVFNVVDAYEIVEQEIDHDRETSFDLINWVDMKLTRAPADYQAGKAAGKYRCRVFEDGNKKKFVYYESRHEIGKSIGFYRYVIRCTLSERDSGRILGSAVASCSSLESKYIRTPRNAENTILQMAQKRAKVRVVRTGLGLSDRFTQDEDLVEANGADEPKEEGE